MPFATTHDGVEIFFKDWGPQEAQPIVFHHGWPLSADDWDAQMLFFLAQGFRVIAPTAARCWLRPPMTCVWNITV